MSILRSEDCPCPGGIQIADEIGHIRTDCPFYKSHDIPKPVKSPKTKASKPSPPNGISALLRRRREELGLSQREIANRLPELVSDAYICQLETGKCSNPTLDKVVALAAAYGLTIEAIVSAFQAPAATCKTCGRPM